MYREQVAALGGRVPAAALAPQRLRHNALDAAGIEAPDGLVHQLR